MQLESSIITAISTLLAVLITLYFTNKREKSKFFQDLKLKEFNDLEAFYIKLLASLEKTKNYTKHGENYKELFNDNSLISAKANILAPDDINKKIGEVSDLLYEWSSLYRKSLPTKIDDSGLGMISNSDYEYRKKANEVYIELQKEISILVEMIKEELKRQKEKLKNQ